MSEIQLSSHWLFKTQILKHILVLFCVVFFRQPLSSSFSVDPHSFQSQLWPCEPRFTALVNPGSFTAFSGFSPGILYPPHTLPSGRTALTLPGHMVLCLVGSFIYSSFRSFHRPSHKVSMSTMFSGGDAIGGLKVPALKGLAKWRKWTSIEESHRNCKMTALL